MFNKFLVLPTLVLTLATSQIAFAERGEFAMCMKNAYKNLKLTSEQQTKIKTMKDQMMAGMKDKEVQMQAMHAEVKTLVQADTLDESKLDALVTQKKDIIGAMMKNKIMMRHEVYHLLTPKQKEEFVAKVEKCEQKMVKMFEGSDDAG
jgi:protein CpxP